MSVETAQAFQPYLPRLVTAWSRETPDAEFRVLPGSLLSLDISGFTSLSERLQARGRAGAEELILLVSGIFEGLIRIAERRGGDVLKFRGDALLILFAGDEHGRNASLAAAEMQWLIEQGGETVSSVGAVRLRMSCGIYSGDCHFFLAGSSHRELVVAGPASSATVELESGAEAGEILVSAATAAKLPAEWLGGERDGARLIEIPQDALGDGPGEAPTHELTDGNDLAEYVPAPLRAQLALGIAEPEHRHVTAAFVRFGDIDRLLAAEGAETVYERIAVLGMLVGEAADDLGVTWLESDIDVGGGKFYLVSGAPAAAGDEEERMLRALRRIVDADVGLPLKAGVNRGPVFAGDIGAASRHTYAVMGDTVNLAARLTARAEPGGILASAEVLDRARTRFETTHQPFLMKGKERAVTAYHVGAPIGVRAEEASGSLPLVGREQELALLTEAVNAARMRQSKLVELVGEPGIGKSRLVEELRTLAVGFQQLTTRCEAYEQSNPYFAVRSLLRPLAGITPEQGPAEAGTQLGPWVQAVMPDLAPWLPLLAIPFGAEVEPTPESDSIEPAFRRDKLHEVVEQFMTRVLMMPTLIVVEDTHWIDDASDFLFRHLAASSMPRPWLVCVTSRPEGRRLVQPERDTLIELELLPPELVSALALSAADELPLGEVELAALTERAGGNPLFVRELVAAAREGGSFDALPESVESLLTARIDQLDPGDKLLIRYASVVGPTFDLELLGEILADEPVEAADLDRWNRLAEFVEWEGSGALRFRHDLFRAMAYEALSFRRRSDIHGRVAVALEARAGDDVDEVAGLLSLHFLAAGRHPEAWRYAVLAGRRAQARYANVVAAELYERAMVAARELPDLPAAEVASVSESLGDVRLLFGAYARAGEAYAEALQLAGDDRLERARLLRKSGVVAERAGDYEQAFASYEQALTELDTADETPAALAIRVDVEIAYSGSLYYQARYDECIEWALRAATHAEATENRSGLAHASYLLGLAFQAVGRPDPRWQEQARTIYEETGELVGHGVLLNNMGLEASETYRWDEAFEHFRRGVELSSRAGDVTNVARLHVNEADVLAQRGLLEDAETLLREAMRVWRASNYPLAVAITSSNLGRIVGWAGRFPEAIELLTEAREAFRMLENPLFAVEASARIADVHVLAGDYKEALELAQTALEEAGALNAHAALLALLERVLGYALVQARRPDDGRPHLRRSLEIAREAGALFEIALSAKALADTGAPDAAALAAESAEILERLGVVSVPRVPLP